MRTLPILVLAIVSCFSGTATARDWDVLSQPLRERWSGSVPKSPADPYLIPPEAPKKPTLRGFPKIEFPEDSTDVEKKRLRVMSPDELCRFITRSTDFEPFSPAYTAIGLLGNYLFDHDYPKGMAVFVDLLDDERPGVRRQVLSQLLFLRAATIMPARDKLVKLLEHSDQSIVESAILVLGHLPDCGKAVTERILKLLERNSDGQYTRKPLNRKPNVLFIERNERDLFIGSCLSTLGSSGSVQETFPQRVADLTEHYDLDIRGVALFALTKLSPTSEKTIAILNKALSVDRIYVQIAAIECFIMLNKLAKNHHDLISKRLLDPNKKVRLDVLEFIARYPQFIEPNRKTLLWLMSWDSSRKVRALALAVLSAERT